MAFLLTVFDARLGWWLGNPRWRDASRRPGPDFALKYLFAELLGQTTARSKFVNLSDGGHFDNLGLYELVRRRCRYIIICDSEQDGDLTFGSLGGAIRKCRADFGVEIDINPESDSPRRTASARRTVWSARIIYPGGRCAHPRALDRAAIAPGPQYAVEGARLAPVSEVEPHRRRAGRRHRIPLAHSGVPASEHRRSVLLRVTVRELSPAGPAHRARCVRRRAAAGWRPATPTELVAAVPGADAEMVRADPGLRRRREPSGRRLFDADAPPGRGTGARRSAPRARRRTSSAGRPLRNSTTHRPCSWSRSFS